MFETPYTATFTVTAGDEVWWAEVALTAPGLQEARERAGAIEFAELPTLVWKDENGLRVLPDEVRTHVFDEVQTEVVPG